MVNVFPSTPFVLLDDARSNDAAPARLYTETVEIIRADTLEEVAGALDLLKAAQARGLHAAGFMAYEAGYALEGRFSGHTNQNASPLLWFGLFRDYTKIAPSDVPEMLSAPNTAWVGTPKPRIKQADYIAALNAVQAYITAGDIYQANLTFLADVPFQGHPLALYAGLRERAQAGYGGVVFTGEEWLLSLSPELFFTLQDGKMTTKPMKGTARASDDPDSLFNDPKQRAENLMIVDLLRNDLSRVAEAGSVAVPALFEIERYPTVHQMTSTITAQLRAGLDATDVLRAIFPCGSITGAPKIRAMEIIAEIEHTPRGAYTGSIGRIDANGDAAFNVAIRTLQFKDGANTATLGLGSGIVADSVATTEWQECADKGAFVAAPVDFDLLETMRFDPDGGITLLDGHIARLGASAKQFGFTFNRHDVRNALQAATIRFVEPRRIRLLLAKSGAVAIEIGKLPPTPEGVVEVAVSPLPVSTDDFRVRHKTSSRAFYAEARAKAASFEVLFTDHQGFLTEGSFSNIFVHGDGVLLTPPLARGLLPGVLRGALIENGSAVEADLRVEDLANGFFIGNASRGLLPAKLKT
jgi:para-aminobenzoate synthetase/4-amino-4-deoxychorismate lyase